MQNLKLLTEELIKRDLELWEERELFKKLFLILPIPTALITLEGIIKLANPALANTLGYTTEELKGMHFSAITHADDLEKDLSLFNKLITDPHFNKYEMRKTYVTKKGKLIKATLRVALIEDTTSKPISVVGLFFDIEHVNNEFDKSK